MNESQVIDNLLQIRRSIMLGAGGGVTDTAWMEGVAPSETIVDRIDYMLVELGVKRETIELLNEKWITNDKD